MDTAGYAHMSDPNVNPHFRRRWAEPDAPPQRDAPERPRTLEDTALAVVAAWRSETRKRSS